MPNQSQETLFRLTAEVYAQLERKHTRLSVSATTTPIEAAFQLGVQAVLRDLRNGYRIEPQSTKEL